MLKEEAVWSIAAELILYAAKLPSIFAATYEVKLPLQCVRLQTVTAQVRVLSCTNSTFQRQRFVQLQRLLTRGSGKSDKSWGLSGINSLAFGALLRCLGTSERSCPLLGWSLGRLLARGHKGKSFGCSVRGLSF